MLMRPSDDRKAKIRGIVRHVKMHQIGHFMMGTMIVAGHKITLSGTYGSDGLACDVPHEVYELGVDLPDELYEAWNKGEGWNEAGKEGLAMFDWGKIKVMKQRKGRK